MKTSRLTLGAALFALAFGAATTGQSQISPQGGGYLLRIKYTKGEKAKYIMKISSPMMKQPMTMTMMQSTKAVNGTSATVDYDISSPQGGMGSQKVTVDVDNRGRVLKTSAPGGDQLNNVQLPEKPIRIGETWSGDVSSKGGMAGIKMKSLYKLVGVKNMGGGQCAQIAVSMSGGNAQMKIDGSGTIYLRMKDGSIETTSLATNVTMNRDGKPMKVAQSITISRG